eukprot:TRINITY_DN2151_c0_g1_i2.p1 TRINITY_DN2151_c0_g1~~TRINITY_DN2151_c0_g1_i2.p1  ORF type:complete len:145 (+),score=14.51 TRINITY_DN2151_c0_g1_i2:60-494(+)
MGCCASADEKVDGDSRSQQQRRASRASEGRTHGAAKGGTGRQVGQTKEDGRRLGGADAGDGDLREKVAQAALARADGKPQGVSSETAAKLKDKHERDELIGRIDALAARLREDVPLAIRSRDTPLSKLRSYKTFLEQKIREKGL